MRHRWLQRWRLQNTLVFANYNPGGEIVEREGEERERETGRGRERQREGGREGRSLQGSRREWDGATDVAASESPLLHDERTMLLQHGCRVT